MWWALIFPVSPSLKPTGQTTTSQLTMWNQRCREKSGLAKTSFDDVWLKNFKWNTWDFVMLVVSFFDGRLCSPVLSLVHHLMQPQNSWNTNACRLSRIQCLNCEAYKSRHSAWSMSSSEYRKSLKRGLFWRKIILFTHFISSSGFWRVTQSSWAQWLTWHVCM